MKKASWYLIVILMVMMGRVITASEDTAPITDLMVILLDTGEDPYPAGPEARGAVTTEVRNALSSKGISAVLMTTYILAVALKVYNTLPLDAWHSFELTPDFFLFVPKSVQLNDPDVEAKTGLKLRSLVPLSPSELQERLKRLNPLKDAPPKEPSFEDAQLFSKKVKQLFFDEKTKESALFVTLKERNALIKRGKIFPERRFVLVFEGHGVPPVSLDEEIEAINREVASYAGTDEYHDVAEWGKKEIAKVEKRRGKDFFKEEGQFMGIMASDFSSLVFNFFDPETSVYFIFSNTCYGGGQNLQQALFDTGTHFERATKKLTLGFGASVGAPVAVFSGKSNKNYTKFIEELSSSSHTDLMSALKHIYPLYDDTRFFSEKNAKGASYGNVPLIKLPGQKWVSTLEKLPSVGSVLASMRSPQDPLNVRVFFNMKPQKRIFRGDVRSDDPHYKPQPVIEEKRVEEPLLLYATNIPFPLIFDDKLRNFPSLIPMIPGTMVFEFGQITAPTFLLSDVIEAFFSIEGLVEDKAFVIKNIEARDDLPGSSLREVAVFEAYLLNKNKGESTVEHEYFIIRKKEGLPVEAFRYSCMQCFDPREEGCTPCIAWGKRQWRIVSADHIREEKRSIDAFIERCKKAKQVTARGVVGSEVITPAVREQMDAIFGGRGAIDSLSKSLQRLAQSLSLLTKKIR